MATEGVETEKEEISFTADISQLMNIIINSFYSKKEIFLRELLSNSSDALEKYRYQSITNPNLSTNQELKIRIKVNKNENYLVISDTGIGMTHDDIIKCLGTIANSGTKKFFEQIESKEDTEHIGQFGVGFYSAFLVADKVKVVTKHEDDKEFIWESESRDKYTLVESENPELERGTEIYLYLKENEREYLETAKIKEIVKKYTECINYPIEILELKQIEEEVVKNVD